MSGNEVELTERVKLIEDMIAQGRRTTESWGWIFVLWGVAYYVAIFWTTLFHSVLAWPVTMIGACVLTAVLVAVKRRDRPNTTMGRAIGSIWIAVGISMFLLFLSAASHPFLDKRLSISPRKRRRMPALASFPI